MSFVIHVTFDSSWKTKYLPLSAYVFTYLENINDESDLEALCVVEIVGECWGEKQGYLLNPPDVPSTLPR